MQDFTHPIQKVPTLEDQQGPVQHRLKVIPAICSLESGVKGPVCNEISRASDHEAFRDTSGLVVFQQELGTLAMED